MSTLRINTLENASGGDGIDQGVLFNGVPRVWSCLNGTGTIAADDDYNVSSYTDNGVGDYTTSYTNNLSASTYAVGSGNQSHTGVNIRVTYCIHGGSVSSTPTTKSTSQVRMASGNSNTGAGQDTQNCVLSINGYLA